MKTHIQTICLSILFLTLYSAQYCNAQLSGNWKLLGISTTSNYKGIEGYYRLAECNGKDVVDIKLVNTNAFSVKAGWMDIAYTNDNKLIQDKNVPDSLTISANSSVEGKCGGIRQLEVKLSELGINKNNLGTFSVSHFDFITINQ